MPQDEVHRTHASPLLGALQDQDVPGNEMMFGVAAETAELDRLACEHSLVCEHALSLANDDLLRIAAILRRNLRLGRAQRVMAKQGVVLSATTWLAYQRQVVQVYWHEYGRVYRLAENDRQAWEQLWRELANAARLAFLRCCMGCAAAEDRACDASQQACVQIYANAFPFDAPFSRWACAILKNCILQVLTRSNDLLDRHPYIASIDDLDAPRGAFAAAQWSEDAYAHSDKMSALLDAIERMQSQNRRQVLMYSYFEDMDDKEIAEAMHRSTGVIHTLRHRALRQLREIMAEEE